ncbi:MAG: phosphate acyltransferase PlsX [Azoarcus sp.]|jgi:glycerol-3-phosphate acyltransferase PlsX|nr:phosphate acyltransferase PlsX [Azoarcus sp.]
MSVTIAVDCMGGDHGPSVTVPASLAFLRDHPAANAVLVGREEVLRPLAGEAAAGFGTRLRIHNATQVIGMDEPLVSAMRTKKDSSMRVAAELVKAGQAQAAVSAGNTGALVAVSRFVLKMLPGIDRPAICFALPTVEGHTYALDLGANVDCTAEHLLQFGIMGTVLASVLDHSERPSVGLLNVGAEEIKGNEVTKKATELLRASNLNFYGNVEGDDIYKGVTDVVVCDGFVGNVALKTTEGLARMMATFLREEFERGPLSLLMGAVAQPVLKRFKRRADPRRYNGAVLLGLRGIVVKSHGSADILSFEQALARAADAAGDRLVERIGDRVAAITGAKGGQDA